MRAWLRSFTGIAIAMGLTAHTIVPAMHGCAKPASSPSVTLAGTDHHANDASQSHRPVEDSDCRCVGQACCATVQPFSPADSVAWNIQARFPLPAGRQGVVSRLPSPEHFLPFAQAPPHTNG